jgi:hypothetical protein
MTGLDSTVGTVENYRRFAEHEAAGRSRVEPPGACRGPDSAKASTAASGSRNDSIVFATGVVMPSSREPLVPMTTYATTYGRDG